MNLNPFPKPNHVILSLNLNKHQQSFLYPTILYSCLNLTKCHWCFVAKVKYQASSQPRLKGTLHTWIQREVPKDQMVLCDEQGMRMCCCMHYLRCARGYAFSSGALLGRVLVTAVITMLVREDRWCVLFIETIKEALRAIKHASGHPFLNGFKRRTLEHSAINPCSKILCHMKWTTSHITHIYRYYKFANSIHSHIVLLFSS